MQSPNNPREVKLAERVAERAPARPIAPPSPESPGISVGDIYFTLFRHKFKIVLCALAGIAAAFAFHKVTPKAFQSDAKLIIRYVMESRTPTRDAEDANVRSIDNSNLSILASEIEIITSRDLAAKVVDTLGPERFLPLRNDGLDRERAIILFSRSLAASVPARTNVIHLQFVHRDPALVQPALQSLITNYLKKHVATHRATGFVDDFLTQETDQARNRLAQTEENLRRAKAKAGVASIEDAKKAVADLITLVRQSLNQAETELAERNAFVKVIEASGAKPIDPSAAKPELPPESVIASYTQYNTRIEALLKNEQELLTQFTPENSRVKDLRAQIVEAETARKQLEETHPTLALLKTPATTGPQPARTAETADLLAETAKAHAAQAKIAALNSQLAKLKEEAMMIDSMEAEIVDLNRQKDLEEANYRKYKASLDQARREEALSTGPVSNISEIQSPSSASPAKSKRRQIMMMLAVGGLFAGLAWAFVIELLLDTTIKRPIEVEKKLNLPLMLSIPVVDRSLKRQLLALNPPADPNAPKPGNSKNAESATALALQPFHATLRDRLIGFFESRNLTHKPKLIAVTGLAKGSGVSTTAAGIAQSLSETGEGNVLLVSMNSSQQDAQQFFQGKPVTQLDDLLAAKTRAPVQENLYVVTEGSNSDRLLRNMPQRFSKLLPKLRASDFDYIIFDMPTVSQVSITPRLAGFMDIVLMVLESEKTDRGLVQKATALLEQSKAQVGVVLNKTRTYVPARLHQETLRDL